jgi:hypothetical protein
VKEGDQVRIKVANSRFNGLYGVIEEAVNNPRSHKTPTTYRVRVYEDVGTAWGDPPLPIFEPEELEQAG